LRKGLLDILGMKLSGSFSVKVCIFGRYVQKKGFWLLIVWLLVFPLVDAGNTAVKEEAAKPSVVRQDIILPASWLIPEHFHDVFNVIVDNVPYLHQQNIKVKERSLGTTMTVRPTLGSLIFKKRDNRTYLLHVNNNPAFDGVLYDDVPDLARVGLIMHELMHIKDYQSRGFFGVLQRGWQYLSKKGKKKFEHEIDNMVMDAGFRNYLYLWAHFIMEESEASDAYKDFKKEIYLCPVDIFIDLDEDGILQDAYLIL
jgi:hypothetical protein